MTMTPPERDDGGMTRAERLQWAKERALEYVDLGELGQAFTSFGSDLGKFPQFFAGATRIHSELGMSLLIAGHLRSADQMRRWIEGFR